jgi:hypothetical protein
LGIKRIGFDIRFRKDIILDECILKDTVKIFHDEPAFLLEARKVNLARIAIWVRV